MYKQFIITILAVLFTHAVEIKGQHQMGPSSKQSTVQPKKKIIPLQFRNVGPTRGGRVTAVYGVVKEPGTFYMGATGGGVWKTTNYGYTWKNISDGYFASPSIGAIAVYQKQPDIIYVGTGSDGIRSNIIVGKGIYKSIDAGKTWGFAGLKMPDK